MILQEQIALFSLVFLPLLASIFIMLISNVDIEAQKTLSKFFALIEMIVFIYIFYLLFKRNILATTAFKLDFINININFYLQINNYNIFSYFLSVTFLFVNVFFAEKNITENYLKESLLFLFAFIMHIIIGQNDIKIALPIVSLSSFLMFFIIAINKFAFRGSVIFKAGIFLICCDSICLIMIQTKNNFISLNSPIITFVILLTPALARMSLPMFLPFVKQLYFASEEEACIVITFSQILGFFLLTLIYNDINFSFGLSLVIISMSFVGILYLLGLLFFEKDRELINYYLLLFYSSICVILFFIDENGNYIKLSLMLFISNVFSYTISFYIYKKSKYFFNYEYFNIINKFSYVLLLGIPGLGVGCSLWVVIWHLIKYKQNNIICYFLLLLFIIHTIFLITSVNNNLSNNSKIKYLYNDDKIIFHSSKNYILLFFLGVIINFIVPLLTIYKFKG